MANDTTPPDAEGPGCTCHKCAGPKPPARTKGRDLELAPSQGALSFGKDETKATQPVSDAVTVSQGEDFNAKDRPDASGDEDALEL